MSKESTRRNSQKSQMMPTAEMVGETSQLKTHRSTWRFTKPGNGFCVKTTDDQKNKVFINICKLDEIPEPKDITESELLELWQSEEVSDYRIPLSIQEPHDEFDKSGKPTVVYDVAVNTKFFKKIQENMVFRSFVMQVVLEGVESKYNLTLKKDGYVVLQNRRCLGELKPHRIRLQKTPYQPPRPLIQELSSTKSSELGGTTVEKKKSLDKPPEFRFFENKRSKLLVGEFHLPNIVTFTDLKLDVGEDRIVLENRRGSCLLDLFIPVRIDETNVAAQFNKNTRMLTVAMPIISVSDSLDL